MAFTYDFPRASLTVDSIILCAKNEPSVLLIKRKNEPYKDSWAFPGGFLDMDETLITAAHRELKEETGIICEELTQFGIYDSIDRDPRGRTISVVYYTFVEEELKAIAQDDAIDVQWFKINKLPKLAFDHDKIISDIKKSILK